MSPEQDRPLFRHSFDMRSLSTSNAAFLSPTCDEEFADEADEPPDHISNYFFKQIDYHMPSFFDEEFSKHSIYDHPPPKESLLTRALLTSPTLGPVDRPAPPCFGHGMSNSSVWSNTSAASTADLTSDADITSPSRANTPSSPPPMYLTGIAGVLHRNNNTKPALAFNEPKRIEVVSDKESAAEGNTRRRCITFACATGQVSRRGSEAEVSKMEEAVKKQVEQAAPKKNSSLTFVCAQREDSQTSARPQRLSPPAPKHIDFALVNRSAAPVQVEAPVINNPVTFASKVSFKERQLYDSESASDSWTNLPIDKTRLLRVDDLLRKEMDIRKLSEEAEAEALQEEGLEDEDEEEEQGDEEEEDDTMVDEDEDEEDDDYLDDDDDDDDEDEEEEEEEYDGESGNETDNEEGFASEDEEDDVGFFALHPPMSIPSRPTGTCGMPRSYGTSPRQIRPGTPELPDSTDFVCGTFDEDKPLEDAYLSALEERKRSKHKATPQDIDPSFPTSEPEDSDHESPVPRAISRPNRDESSSDGNQSRGRRIRGAAAKDQSPPRGRMHSPAPMRRTALAQSPAPSRRVRSRSRQSRHISPPPPVSRRGSRVLSPAPVRRRPQFSTGNDIVRARSLPRNPGLARRVAVSSRANSAAGSPQKATRPVVIRRGAMDIVKGLEKKRERRSARFSKKDKEGLWRAGKGVEKMRELGLEMCGKGRSRPIWVISA